MLIAYNDSHNKASMQILVDQDGVLADFELGFYNAWQATEYAEEFSAIEVASRKVFYIAHEYPAHFKEQVYELIMKKSFFENLPPIAGAVEALKAMHNAGHDVVICTSPMNQWQNCVAEKYAWVEKHLGHEWTKCMIITQDKTLVCGDVLIDDKPMVTGLMIPVWTHILYDSPYNRAENNITLQNELTDKPRLTSKLLWVTFSYKLYRWLSMLKSITKLLTRVPLLI